VMTCLGRGVYAPEGIVADTFTLKMDNRLLRARMWNR
jgi:hypothetical protein